MIQQACTSRRQSFKQQAGGGTRLALDAHERCARDAEPVRCSAYHVRILAYVDPRLMYQAEVWDITKQLANAQPIWFTGLAMGRHCPTCVRRWRRTQVEHENGRA